MKYEWKKSEKNIYLPKEVPTLIEMPKMNYFIIDGEGDPNTSAEFAEAIQALYSLSYGIRMLSKSDNPPKDFFEYTVYPLEGIWDMKVDEHTDFSKLDKNKFIFSLMIRQPSFVDKKLALEIIEKTKKKKYLPGLDKARFETIDGCMCVQMMHIGSYDDEPKSFDKMLKFCEEHNLMRTTHQHREIYISDPRKVDAAKRKTTLRINVKYK